MKQMTRKEVHRTASAFIRHLHLPRQVDGIAVLIADYADDAAIRILKPDNPGMTLRDQRALNQALARIMRRSGATVSFVPVDAAAYLGWLSAHGLSNNAGNRAQYVSWLTCPEPRFRPQNENAHTFSNDESDTSH